MAGNPHPATSLVSSLLNTAVTATTTVSAPPTSNPSSYNPPPPSIVSIPESSVRRTTSGREVKPPKCYSPSDYPSSRQRRNSK